MNWPNRVEDFVSTGLGRTSLKGVNGDPFVEFRLAS